MSEPPDVAADATDDVEDDEPGDPVTEENEVISNDDVQKPPDQPMPLHLADLPLHSPSSDIVGTPFSDIHSTRFEYPFPDAAGSPDIPVKRSSPQSSPTISSPSSSMIVSASQPQLIVNPPPALHHYPASFPPRTDLPNYSPTHPKMRAVSPPVPPALVKRRQRWTLGLGSLGRKLSLRGSSSAGPDTPDVEQPPEMTAEGSSSAPNPDA